MKLTVAILIIGLTHVSAAINAQITIKEKNIPLQTALKTISQQSGYDFIYSDQVFKDAHPVSLNLNNAPIETALSLCFKDQPLTYKIEDKTVMVRRKTISDTKTVANNIANAPQDNEVRIHVTDSTGQPLPGASITVKGSKQGGSTDAQGNITLTSLTGGETLVVAYIGYETKEITIRDRENISVVLKVSTNPLDEMQIIAYGTTSKRFSTGNISTVTDDQIEKSPVTNVLLALEGRVPGVFIRQQTGYSGSQVNVQIQGRNSIGSGNEPFYVVDGVPYPASSMSRLSTILGGSDGSPLNYLNPDDIESISVLKDADATSIYGSRAANGAILITTKKGASGAMRINASFQQGIGMVPHKMELLNTQQYLNMRNQALANDSIDLNTSPWNTPNWFSSFVDLTHYDTTRYTDWQKVLLGNKAHYTDADLSFSGGNNNVNYLIGTNFHRETTVFPGTFSDLRGSLHFNVSGYSNNRKFHIQLSGSYLKDNNQLPDFDYTQTALTLPPNAPALYNPDGSLNFDYVDGVKAFDNPATMVYNHYSLKTDNLVGNALLSYELLKGLNIKSTFGYTENRTTEWEYPTDSVFDPLTLQNPSFSRYSSYGTTNMHTWDIEPQITYNTSFQKHHLAVLMGSSFQESTTLSQSYWLDGFNSDHALQNVKAASSISVRNSTISDYKYNAIFGRIGYNYDNKYILNLNVRRDGSSRFGSENRFHNFASFAGAWVFSEENAIESNLTFLSFGKLRASYGTTGNDQIQDYRYLSLYNNYTALAGIPYQTGSTGLYPTSLPNPYLQWESTKKLQFGLDLGFAKDRILLNANYNINRSSNQLLYYTLPAIAGFTGISQNFPATVQNTGWEITLSTVNVKGKDFQWRTSANITIPKNKLVAFPNLATSSYASSLVIGKSINIRRFNVFAGVDPQTGIYQFAAEDGGFTSDPGYPGYGTGKTVFLNLDPRYYGGIENTLVYKSLSLSFLFQFASQIGRNYYYGIDNPGGLGNQPSSILNNVWQKPGDQASVQRYSNGMYAIPLANATNGAYLDLESSNVSFSLINYWRLKNLSLSWQLPKSWTAKTGLQTARIYLQGQNLLTFTNHYIGMDPESQSLSLPPLKVITAGINISL
ncbi:SusC/RagA family TonB-linked outer membrane protein [Arachidicoccus terrestris]|uniref:SusC/RagA family TonB-linked outer membrane protein n=1 Tax=Arachidicoccus terrestris TaxID=2875539 RepID=UPI001CC63B7D|nr:SusC/RagA family TonB-linked outer membrane protein [Arachidicoccus terrestris]UAY55734.1 SusC/RagA family TonB-linked outer membrane protein [Arachidicoccus terrestris]